MLSSRLVLPERYGPHSATTRCAPLPGLPPVMVSDLMSFMTTSSLPRVRLRMKAPDGGRCRTRPERSLVPEIVSPRLGGVNPPVWRRVCPDSRHSGTKQRSIDILFGATASRARGVVQDLAANTRCLGGCSNTYFHRNGNTSTT